MFGCPYDFIYSSRHTLTTLLAQPTFRYIGGVVVERLEERGDAVIVQARTVAGEHVSYEAERVFVGAGAMPTTKIVMDTLGLDETKLKDSQYFLLPMLQMTGSGARKEDLHTLAQVFIEIREPSISDRTVHLQLYTYNEIYDLELRRRFGRLYPLVPSGMLLDRMSLIQGFLHSDDSRQVTVRRRDGRELSHTRDREPRGAQDRPQQRAARGGARASDAADSAAWQELPLWRHVSDEPDPRARSDGRPRPATRTGASTPHRLERPSLHSGDYDNLERDGQRLPNRRGARGLTCRS